MPHRLATLQLEHEWHVLEQQPPRLAAPRRFEQPKHVFDETGTAAGDSCRTTRLTEILAGESRGQHVHTAEGFEFADVACERHAGKARLEDAAGARIDFTEQRRPMACSGQAELDCADARKKPCDDQRLA